MENVSVQQPTGESKQPQANTPIAPREIQFSVPDTKKGHNALQSMRRETAAKVDKMHEAGKSGDILQTKGAMQEITDTYKNLDLGKYRMNFVVTESGFHKISSRASTVSQSHIEEFTDEHGQKLYKLKLDPQNQRADALTLGFHEDIDGNPSFLIGATMENGAKITGLNNALLTDNDVVRVGIREATPEERVKYYVVKPYRSPEASQKQELPVDKAIANKSEELQQQKTILQEIQQIASEQTQQIVDNGLPAASSDSNKKTSEQKGEGIQYERYKKQQELIKQALDKGRSTIYTWGAAGRASNTAGYRFIYEENDPRNDDVTTPDKHPYLAAIQNPKVKVFTDRDPRLVHDLDEEIQEKIAGKHGIYETVVLTDDLPFADYYRKLQMTDMLQEPKFSVIYTVSDRQKADPESSLPNERRPVLFTDGVGRPGNEVVYTVDLPQSMKPTVIAALQEDPTIMRKMYYSFIENKYSKGMQDDAKMISIPFNLWNGERNKELREHVKYKNGGWNIDYGVNKMLVLDLATMSKEELAAFKNPATQDQAIEQHTTEFKVQQSSQTPDQFAFVLPKIS